MSTILDFHIRPCEKKGSYSLEIFERCSSQPLMQSLFDYDLSYLTSFEIRQLDSGAKDPHTRIDLIRAFGTKLYKTVFTPEVHTLWQKYRERSDFLVLCLRLAPEAQELEALPWEALYDGEEFLAAGAKTGFSRLPLDVAVQEKLPSLPSPLKMFALLSSPLDLEERERLAIEDEQEILLQATNAPAGRGLLQIDFEDEAKLPIIESELEKGGYQIFHYTGHGISAENGGGLLLEGPDGKKRATSVAECLQAFQRGEKHIRLAVLSGCQTARTLHAFGFRDLARGLLRHKIPAVMAMQFSLSDKAGLLFAQNLYPRLIDGQPLEMAVSATRRALWQTDMAQVKADAFAPVLFSAHSRPLEIAAPDPQGFPQGTSKALSSVPSGIDFSYHLPLPQLDYGFYGRRKEYRAIRDGLLYQNHRLVLIHGIGGIGKTALVSHSARRLRSHFKGVYAFDCSSGTLAPEMILLELHRYLERQNIHDLAPLLHQSLPPDHLAGYMAQVLSRIPLLIIFDNFETQLTLNDGRHEIENDNVRLFLTTLVKTTAQGSRFLITSRRLFDVDAGRIGTIQDLALGDLSRPEALGLMQKLPHLASASFEDKLRAFTTFGGHPYALVTLDRHCRSRSLAEVLDDAANVQAELREFLAIELSYQTLPEPGRELLNRLAAFRAPVPPDAVQWVMGKKVELPLDFIKNINRNTMPEEMKSMSDEELLQLFQQYLPEERRADNTDTWINELISWGLLLPIEEDGQVCALAVHSLVRDFCRDKKQDDWSGCLSEAASYYTNKTKLLQQDGKSPAAVMSEMEAFELLMEAGEYEKAASLVTDAAPLFGRWGMYRYAESLHQRIIPKVKRETQSILFHNLGNFFEARGDYSQALTQYEKSLKIEGEIGDRAGVATSLHSIGNIHYLCGDYSQALTQYEKSLKIKEEIGDRAGLAGSLYQIGMIHHARGDYSQALTQYEKSLKIAEEIGHRAGLAKLLHQIGNIHYDRGDYSKALAEYEKSLKIEEEIGDRAGVARSLHQIGMIHHARGDYIQALSEYEKSLKILEEIGDRAGVAKLLHQIGMIHHDRGDYSQALSEYEKSLKIEEEIGDRAGVARSLHQIGMIHYDRGDYSQALTEYEKSLKIKEEIGDRAGVASSLGQIGKLCIITHEYARAFENLTAALLIFDKIQSPNAKIVMNALKELRSKWEGRNFDAAWEEKPGGPVPEILMGNHEGNKDA